MTIKNMNEISKHTTDSYRKKETPIYMVQVVYEESPVRKCNFAHLSPVKAGNNAAYHMGRGAKSVKIYRLGSNPEGVNHEES